MPQNVTAAAGLGRLFSLSALFVSSLASQVSAQQVLPPQHVLPQYTAPGGGAPRDVMQKLSDTVNAHDFTPCNGQGDDLPGLQRAEALLLSRGGGTIHIPPGVCVVSDQFVVQNRVNLQGDNVAASQINAGSNFPSNRAVVRLGAPKGGLDGHYQALRDLAVEAAGDPDSTAIQADNMQEGSLLYNVNVFGYGKYGIDIEGGQNSHLDDIYSGAQSQSNHAVGIHIANVTSRFEMSHITIYGGDKELPEFHGMRVSETNAAIELVNGTQARIADLHVEGFRYGIYVGQYAYAEIDDFYGCFNLPTMIWFDKTSGGGMVRHLQMYPWDEPYGVPQAKQIGIRDDLHGIATKALLNASVDEYITNPGTLFTTARGVMSSMDQLQTETLNAKTAAIEHLSGAGGTPSCSPGQGAGAGGTCHVIAGHDASMEVQVNTGRAPSSGPLFTVTWSVAFDAVPYATAFPTSLNGAAVNLVYLRSQSTAATAAFAVPGALAPQTVYTFEVSSIR